MPLPPSTTTVPVHVKVVSQAGVAGQGVVKFAGPVGLRDGTGNVVVGNPFYAQVLDGNGEATFDLIATDDPDLSPTGWAYTVTVDTDVWKDSFQIQVPVATVGTLELADIAAAVPGPPVVTYVLANTVGQSGGPAGPLDVNKQIPAAQIPATGSVPDATPAAKGVVQLAGDLAGTATAPTVPGLAAKADTAAVNAGLAGRATKPVVRRAYITTGDVTLAANATWTPLPGFELAIPAAVGDDVELSVGALLQSSGSDFFDLVVLVGSAPATIARRASTGTAAATAAGEGDPGLYPNASGSTFRVSNGVFGFTVTPADLDGGNVRFALVVKGSGGGKVFASTGYPYRWRAINHGPVN